MLSLYFASEIIELIASVGLIVSCVLLTRFFRGGIMGQSFVFFTVGSVLFLVDRSITTLISLEYLATEPFTIIHLVLETIFVIILMGGFILLYRNWSRVQRRIPEVSKQPLTVS